MNKRDDIIPAPNYEGFEFSKKQIRTSTTAEIQQLNC